MFRMLVRRVGSWLRRRRLLLASLAVVLMSALLVFLYTRTEVIDPEVRSNVLLNLREFE